MALESIFIILVWVKFKHFLADFPLQGKFMLGKFKDGWAWVIPLLAHVAVHGTFTLGLCLLVKPGLWWLALADMAIHFTMDRLKASKNLLGRWNPDEKMYWWVLGIDQLVHGLTDLWVVYMLVKP